MPYLRQMTYADIDAVAYVDSEAFGGFYRQISPDFTSMPRRTQICLQALIDRDSQGCFVAVERDEVIGYIFSRTWGGAAWFGPFGVLPGFQGRSIGRQLIAASLNYLRQAPGRLIGLETMPESPYNLGLYSRQGFLLRFLTLSMIKSLSPKVEALSLPAWSAASIEQRQRWLSELRQATHHLWPGLDYTKEILLTERYHTGDTFVLLHDDQAVGFATLQLESTRQMDNYEGAAVSVMALHPEHTRQETFSRLYGAAEAAAAAQGRKYITIPLNSQHTWALKRLLEGGYQVDRAMVRMVLEGTDSGPAGEQFVNCSRWAG